jgi:uncharacterized protein YegJ (DUF2314 family)
VEKVLQKKRVSVFRLIQMKPVYRHIWIRDISIYQDGYQVRGIISAYPSMLALS